MNEKFLIALAIFTSISTYWYKSNDEYESVSFTAINVTEVTTITPGFITISDEQYKTEYVSQIDDGGYILRGLVAISALEESFRVFLEEQLQKEKAAEKNSARYSFINIMEFLHPQDKSEERLSDLVLLKRVLNYKLQRCVNAGARYLTGKEDSEDVKEYLRFFLFIMAVSRIQTLVCFILGKATATMIKITKAGIKSLYRFVGNILSKLIFAPLSSMFRKVFKVKEQRRNVDLEPSTAQQSAVLINSPNASDLATESQAVEEMERTVESKKKVVRTSKLKRCDTKKLNNFMIGRNRLIYLYAGECGSRIPRLNARNEELY